MEGQHTPIGQAAEQFECFVDQFDTRNHSEDKPGKYLQTYLVSWLREGNGVVATGRSPSTYLRTALEIADRTMRGEISFDYFGTSGADYKDRYPRTVEALHEPGSWDEHYADPALYEQIACQIDAGEHDSPREAI